MMNRETPSEYMTMAVPTVVGGVLKLATIPPMETGRAATLKDINAWPMAITIIGSQDTYAALEGDTDWLVIGLALSRAGQPQD
jgi:hypothetical protein